MGRPVSALTVSSVPLVLQSSYAALIRSTPPTAWPGQWIGTSRSRGKDRSEIVLLIGSARINMSVSERDPNLDSGPARPLPSTAAPRPIPLFSVVRIPENEQGARSNERPPVEEDTGLGGRSLGQELSDREERLRLRVDTPLLVGPGATREHVLDSPE